MKTTLDEAVARMATAGAHFPWSQKSAYEGWLSQTYYYVRHSTRLLACAAARFSQTRVGDKLHYRFGRHIGEESNHERLALDDIRNIGGQLKNWPELPETRLFYEPQYYKVEHLAPTVLFGYILPLEVLAPKHGEGPIKQVTASFGPSAASFLSLHAREDVDHVEKALAMLDGLPPEDLRWIEENMEQTGLAYARMLEAIVQRSEMG